MRNILTTAYGKCTCKCKIILCTMTIPNLQIAVFLNSTQGWPSAHPWHLENAVLLVKHENVKYIFDLVKGPYSHFPPTISPIS